MRFFAEEVEEEEEGPGPLGELLNALEALGRGGVEAEEVPWQASEHLPSCSSTQTS
jgi:hypothetical protein